MGIRIRQISANRPVACTQRTVDRQMLFRPDAEIRNIIGSSCARAQKKHPVKIYWMVFNSNHLHAGLAPVSDAEDDRNHFIDFRRMFLSLVAQGVNNKLGREGAVFSSRSRDVPCLDNESLEQQLFYAVTNMSKDGLCESVSSWKGFSCYKQLALGEKETYSWIDQTAWHRAPKVNGKKMPIQRFVRHDAIEYTPLPSIAHLPEYQQQRFIKREVAKKEAMFAAERAQKGLRAMSATKLASMDPRDRPKTPAKRSKMPTCHAACPIRAAEYEAEQKEFLCQYRLASEQYRTGDHNVRFPVGSIRPPLIRMAA